MSKPHWVRRPVVELLSVVRNQDFRDLVPTDDVSLDKASYIFLHYGG